MHPTTSQHDIIVLGGGQAGLAAAYRAAQRGMCVTVLEGRETVGGLGGSFELGDIHVDYGSHRLNTACDADVLQDLYHILGDDLLSRPKNSRLRLRGRWIHFPLGLADLVQMPKGLIWDVTTDLVSTALQQFKRRNGNQHRTFPDLLESDLGNSLCHEFYFPYARKIWGLPPEELSVPPSQQQRPGNLFRNVLHAGMATLLGRKRPGVDRFLYPRQGFGQISQGYFEAARKAGAQVALGARVTGIECQDRQVQAVHYEQDGQRHRSTTACIWSTLPLSLLVQCIAPSAPAEVLEAATSLSFRGMLLVYLLIEQNQFTPYDTHFIPDEDIPIARVSEPKNYSAAQEPRGRTVICAEIPCDPTGDLWHTDDAELGEAVCKWLAQANLAVRAPVRDIVVRRLPKTYPIYRIGTHEYLTKIDQWLSQIDGLLTFGLQGLFAHDDSHHILDMAYAAVNCLEPDGTFNWDQWREFRRVFEAHVAEFLRTMNGISL